MRLSLQRSLVCSLDERKQGNVKLQNTKGREEGEGLEPWLQHGVVSQTLFRGPRCPEDPPEVDRRCKCVSPHGRFHS